MSTDKHHHVRERAYHLWEASGRQQGREHEHWLQAENEIGGVKTTKPKVKAADKPKAGAPEVKAEPAKIKAKPPEQRSAKPAAAKPAAAEKPAAKPRATPKKAVPSKT